MVAATSAAMAASSSGERFRLRPCCSDESSLSPPLLSPLLNRSLRNGGASSLSSESCDWTDLRLLDAVSITSDAASFTVDTQSVDLLPDSSLDEES